MSHLRAEAGVTHYYLRRRRQARLRRLKRAAVVAAALTVAMTVAVAIVYAGSPESLARGVAVDGIPVGGLSTQEATALLQRRAAAVGKVPVVFTADGKRFQVRASDIGLRYDWAASVAAARSKGDGLAPLRGFRRLGVRLFGAQIMPQASYDTAALDARVAEMAAAVDRPHRQAAIELRGLKPVVVPARSGVVLDRDAAKTQIAAALASFERGSAPPLPLRTDEPTVTGVTLGPALAQTRRALAKPVRLTLGPTSFRLPRWRIAGILQLPAKGETKLRVAGPGATAYFKRLEGVVNTPARDAQFIVTTGGIAIRPSIDARVLDVPATAEALLAAALSPVRRTAKIAVATEPAKRTTAEAKAMGINGIVASYTTEYGGVPNRIHNVQIVSHLVDNTLIAPGEIFSFNGTTGERNAEKGLLEAPVIINGELQNGLGGGTCQVSTTVFNAAYEAGLPITERTNHSLYIGHYPQGRDATVNYPDIDLKFVNDTGHWLLLRTFVSSNSLTVNLYGTPQHRKVETETAPLRVTGPGPVKRVADPQLLKGKEVVKEPGSSASATSVTRRVYAEDGKLLREATFFSTYRGDTRVVRFGTKEPPKPKPKPKPAAQPVFDPAAAVDPAVDPATPAPAELTVPQ